MAPIDHKRPLFAMTGLRAACSDHHGGFFLLSHSEKGVDTIVWKMTSVLAEPVELGRVRFLNARSIAYDPCFQRLYVLSGGLHGWFGLGYLLDVRFDHFALARLGLANAYAIARLIIRIAVEGLLFLLSRAQFSTFRRKALAKVRAGRFAGGLSWPTYLAVDLQRDILWMAHSSFITKTRASNRRRHSEVIAEGFLNLGSATPWEGGQRLLLSELHLFSDYAYREFGTGAGAVWSMDPATGDKRLLAGGLCDAMLATALEDGKSFVVFCSVPPSGLQHPHLVDIPQGSIAALSSEFSRVAFMLPVAPGEFLVGDKDGLSVLAVTHTAITCSALQATHSSI
jgi:hypothetical protein